MPAIYTCDKCGKPADGEDYDGAVLCDYHDAEKELYLVRARYEGKKKWLKDTHYKDLLEMREEIRRLKKIVNA